MGRGEFAEFDAFDFFVGFRNGDGGVNIWPVEVVPTTDPVGEACRHRVPAARYDELAKSSPPALLLVADALRSELYYAWPADGGAEFEGTGPGAAYAVPLRPADAAGKAELRARFTAPSAHAVARVGGRSSEEVARAAA